MAQFHPVVSVTTGLWGVFHLSSLETLKFLVEGKRTHLCLLWQDFIEHFKCQFGRSLRNPKTEYLLDISNFRVNLEKTCRRLKKLIFGNYFGSEPTRNVI